MGAVLLLLPVQVVSAEPVLWETKLSAEKIPAGETVTLEIGIRWPREEGEYIFKVPALSLKGLRLASQSDALESFRLDDRDFFHKTVRFTLFSGAVPGEAVIESFSVEYHRQNSPGPSGSLDVEAQKVMVRPPPVLGSHAYRAGIALLAAFAGLTGWTVYRRRRKITGPKPEDSDPEAETMAAIRRFKDRSDLPAADKVAAISKLFFRYLSNYYQLHSSQLTDIELFSSIQARDISPDEKKMLRQIFDRAGRAKYTGLTFSAEEYGLLEEDMTRYLHNKQRMITPGASMPGNQ